MVHVFVVAPDLDLRRSLQFALEAEGYAVTCRGSIEARDDPSQFDCTVVDHHSLRGDEEAAIAFCKAFEPVVLLANSLPHALSPSVFKTVLKPMLGAALSEAIRDALRSRVTATYFP